ncbi:MAG: hypothetical protein RJA76_1486 [Bacteroidota bacterium]|jgi:hypothetical protein
MATSLNENGEKKKKSTGKAGTLDMIFNLDHITNGEIPLKWVYRIVYIAFLILVYIYYTMLADGKIHQIAKETAELEEIRADYTTQKAEYMKMGKQSFLANEVKKYGMEPTLIPATKIVINKDLKEEE